MSAALSLGCDEGLGGLGDGLEVEGVSLPADNRVHAPGGDVVHRAIHAEGLSRDLNQNEKPKKRFEYAACAISIN